MYRKSSSTSHKKSLFPVEQDEIRTLKFILNKRTRALKIIHQLMKLKLDCQT